MKKKYDESTLKLKAELFNICKTEFDWASAYDIMLKENSSLITDVFGYNPLEVEPAFEDFYEFNDYEDPKTGECRTFAEWSEYFCSMQNQELIQNIFDLLKARKNIEEIYSTLQRDNDDILDQLSIQNLSDLKSYLEYNDYEDELLEVEQSLLDWKNFFINDEFDLYNTCIELNQQNEILANKLKEIQCIINK